MDEDKKDTTNNKILSEKDQELWDYVSKDVTPLDPSKKRKQKKERENLSPKTHKKLEHDQPLINIQPEKKAKGKGRRNTHDIHGSADIDRALFDRFRKGQMPIEAILDLHGFNQQQAYEKVRGFIQTAFATRKRCIMVITGKGKKGGGIFGADEGVLKRALPEWLEQPEFKSKILKVQQAQRQHGGSGAYYILLKRQKD